MQHFSWISEMMTKIRFLFWLFSYLLLFILFFFKEKSSKFYGENVEQTLQSPFRRAP